VHCGAIDGVYTRDEQGKPRFHFVAPPTPEDIRKVTETIGRRVVRMLRRRGLLRDEEQDTLEAEQGDDALGACCDAGLRRGRFERIDDRGRSHTVRNTGREHARTAS